MYKFHSVEAVSIEHITPKNRYRLGSCVNPKAKPWFLIEYTRPYLGVHLYLLTDGYEVIGLRKSPRYNLYDRCRVIWQPSIRTIRRRLAKLFDSI